MAQGIAGLADILTSFGIYKGNFNTLKNFCNYFERICMREREVESYLIKKVRDMGMACMKFIPDQVNGMPDRMVLLPGSRVLWVELKTKGGKLSEIQKLRHAELKKLGHDVVVVWNKEQVDELVQSLSSTSATITAP